MADFNFKLIRSYERRVGLELNGVAIASANYNDHSWAGLELVEQIAEQMVKTMNKIKPGIAELEETDDETDEEEDE